jgi:hypothetical protein
MHVREEKKRRIARNTVLAWLGLNESPSQQPRPGLLGGTHMV